MRATPSFYLGSLLLCSQVVCSFERGDRYWSGKPQPIGIDFSASHVAAIYANSASNFTTLAIVGGIPDNEYGQYMYAKFAAIKDWGNDDLLIEDLYDPLPETLFQAAISLVSKWREDIGSWSCDKLLPSMNIRPFFRNRCFPDYTFNTKRPKSRYTHLLSQSRMKHLRNIMPKWFRTPRSTQMTRDKLIIDILEYLLCIKAISLSDHGVEITSATISIPSWAYDFEDLFDEACLLADIEVLEQPQDRVSIATETLTSDLGPVLVLDHGPYYLNIHRSTWDERDKKYHQRGSMLLDQPGTMWILNRLAERIIWGYTLNVTEQESDWLGRVKGHVVVNQVTNARLQIKFRSDWPKDLEVNNRTVAMNLTDETGFVRVLNMTGQDIVEVEGEFVEQIKMGIEASVWKHVEIHEYMQSLPNYEQLKTLPFSEYKNIEANIVENVTAPDHIGSWTEPIEMYFILDSGTEASLLHEAAIMALNNFSMPGDDGQGQCVPTIETAARGAAVRALDWVGYWEGWEMERFYWERFDEDNPDTWGDEEDWQEAEDEL